MTPDTGNNAFPLPAHDDDVVGTSYQTRQGMTLLDWFAGQALAGVIVGDAMAGTKDNVGYGDPDENADYAYDLAAAMVSENRRRENL